MPAGIILILIIAFIGNRIFGLYKDETTTRILEEAGAIPRRRKNPQAKGACYSTPESRKRSRTILENFAKREGDQLIRKHFKGYKFCKLIK